MNYGGQVVSRVLAELDVRVVQESNGWGLAFCPLHENTQTPALTVHLTHGAWRCYAGCGQGGDLAQLLAAVRGTDPRDVRRELLQGAAASPDALRDMLADQPPPPAHAWSEPLLYDRGRTSGYMLRRGFSLDTLRRWGVGWDQETRSDVLPLWFGGELVGLVRRPHGGRPAKYVLTAGTDKRRYLFGWDLVPAGARWVALVEGSLDAMWLDQHGYPVVAALGADISDQQAALLAGRFWRVVLALDADRAGRAGTDRALRHPVLRRAELVVLPLPAGRKDVAECTADELCVAFAAVASGLNLR